MGWLQLISAVVALATLLVQWWLSRSPVRRERARRAENAEIDLRVRRGDESWVGEWLRRGRAER